MCVNAREKQFKGEIVPLRLAFDKTILVTCQKLSHMKPMKSQSSAPSLIQFIPWLTMFRHLKLKIVYVADLIQDIDCASTVLKFEAVTVL